MQLFQQKTHLGGSFRLQIIMLFFAVLFSAHVIACAWHVS